jgi:hypothetical protein
VKQRQIAHLKYWTQFAKTGDLEIGRPIAAAKDLNRAKEDLFDTLLRPEARTWTGFSLFAASGRTGSAKVCEFGFFIGKLINRMAIIML